MGALRCVKPTLIVGASALRSSGTGHDASTHWSREGENRASLRHLPELGIQIETTNLALDEVVLPLVLPPLLECAHGRPDFGELPQDFLSMVKTQIRTYGVRLVDPIHLTLAVVRIQTAPEQNRVRQTILSLQSRPPDTESTLLAFQNRRHVIASLVGSAHYRPVNHLSGYVSRLRLLNDRL